MPMVTFDGRSFMLDGRRVWLTSGAIHYARVPRAHWAERIRLARHAGLNCIETPIFWSIHEPRPGVFDFADDLDLRHFVHLIADARMYCILRVGPYIGSGWDMGGLPPWLIHNPAIALRTANQGFLEAASRYITAVADQVRDLQVTSPGGGGPIVLIQNESSWTCGHDQLAESYLGELHRYLREAGLNVPTINANNLWPQVESEIDCWTGSQDMLATMRQLAVVKPSRPRLVIDFSTSPIETIGHSASDKLSPFEIQRRLAEILAGGGQFNIDPFAGGSNFGFRGGRIAGASPGFVTQSFDRQAPVAEHGRPGSSYDAVRKIALFSTHFGKVLSHLDPEYHPIIAAPGITDGGVSVVHRRGSQGDVLFVFAPPTTSSKRERSRHRLLMPDGSTLEVDLASQRVAWCLLNVHLAGRAHLDFCALNALALVGKTLVCFGPAGGQGEISINGSPIMLSVPDGKKPEIIEHEGITLVVCAESHVEHIAVLDDAVLVGVAGISVDGKPIPLSGSRQYTRVDASGAVSTAATEAAAPRMSRTVPTLAPWTSAVLTDYLDGSSARFAAIDAPTDLGRLGAPFGYGWYRATIRSSKARKARIMAPQSADRLHLFADGEAVGVVGIGPGASREVAVPLKSGLRHLVLLADNHGRWSSGAAMGEAKGLFGHLWEAESLKSIKPRLVSGKPIEPLAFRAPLWELRQGDTTDPMRVTWSFAHRKRSPIIIVADEFPARGLLLCNDQPIAFLEQGCSEQYFLSEDALPRGQVHIQVALLADSEDEAHFASLVKRVGESLRLFDAKQALTAKAEWAFAKWEQPPPSAYTPQSKNPKPTGTPTWWKTHFSVSGNEPGIWLDLAGLTKGQVYLNDRHLGRYFVATPDGHRVPPQDRIFLPAGWLGGANNELVIFDEHGAIPGKVRLSVDA
ncbi:MAG: beta-galactosidase [Phycisphaeraceae bacterium]|nr:beta-galactosidase [Phycisphaeraceae bacterium]MCW5754104.1 beta-galactosidase [Phycisphaeraceae bacterium]